MSKKQRGSGPDHCPKVWEKARREKMKNLFDELSRLLPHFDPTAQSSRLDVIQKAMVHIRELHAQNEELLKGGFNEVYKNKIETWKRRVKDLVGRVEQLTGILRMANIHIPPLALGKTPLMWTEVQPKYWTKKINIPDDKIESIIGNLDKSRKRRKKVLVTSEGKELSNKKKKKYAEAKLKKTKEKERITVSSKKQAIVHPLPKLMSTPEVAAQGSIVTVNPEAVQLVTTVSSNQITPIVIQNGRAVADSANLTLVTCAQPLQSSVAAPVTLSNQNVSPAVVSNDTSTTRVINAQMTTISHSSHNGGTASNSNKLNIVIPSPLCGNGNTSANQCNLGTLLNSHDQTKTFQLPRYNIATSQSAVVPITIQSIINTPQAAVAGQTNTFILTNQGNLVPILTPSASVLTPVLVNRPAPVLVLQQPAIPPPQPVILARAPPNKRRIPRDTTVMTFSNSIPIPALSKHSHSRKGAKCGTNKLDRQSDERNGLNPVGAATTAPAVSPTAAFLNAFPVVTSSRSVSTDGNSCVDELKKGNDPSDSNTVNTHSERDGNNSEKVVAIKVDKASQATETVECATIESIKANAPTTSKPDDLISTTVPSKNVLEATNIIAGSNPSNYQEQKNSSEVQSKLAAPIDKQDVSSRDYNALKSDHDYVPRIPQKTELVAKSNKILGENSDSPIAIKQTDGSSNVLSVATGPTLTSSNIKDPAHAKETCTEENNSVSIGCDTAPKVPHNIAHSKVQVDIPSSAADTLPGFLTDSSTRTSVSYSSTFTPAWTSIATMTPASAFTSSAATYVNSTSISSIHTTRMSAMPSCENSWSLPLPTISACDVTLSSITPSSSTSVSTSWRPISAEPLWTTIGQHNDAWSFNAIPKDFPSQLPTSILFEPHQSNSCKTLSSKAVATTQNAVPAECASRAGVTGQIGLYPFSSVEEIVPSRPNPTLSDKVWTSNSSGSAMTHTSTLFNFPKPSTIAKVNLTSKTNLRSTHCGPTAPKAVPVSNYCAQQLIANNFNSTVSMKSQSTSANLPHYSSPGGNSSTNTSSIAYSNISNLVDNRNSRPREINVIDSKLANSNININISHQLGVPGMNNNTSCPSVFPNNNFRQQPASNSNVNYSILENGYLSTAPFKPQEDISPASKVTLDTPRVSESYSSANTKPIFSENVATYSLNVNEPTCFPSYPTSMHSIAYSESGYPSNLLTVNCSNTAKEFAISSTLKSANEPSSTKTTATEAIVTTAPSKRSNSIFPVVSSGRKQYSTTTTTSCSVRKSDGHNLYAGSFSGVISSKPEETMVASAQKASVSETAAFWNTPYFPQVQTSNNIQSGDVGSSWGQMEYACIGEMKEVRPKPPINWMTEPDSRGDLGLCSQDDPFQPRTQNGNDRKDATSSQNAFEFCLNSGCEDEAVKGKAKKREAECSNQDYFSWLSMKVDPFVVPSTLPTLVGDLALGGEPAPSKRSRTIPSATDHFPPSRPKECEISNPVAQEPFTNLSKNIFEFSQAEGNKPPNSTETIVLKNIFELPAPATKPRNSQGQNSFLSVSQLVEPNTIDVATQQKPQHDYLTYYNQRSVKAKRTAGIKVNEKKCQQAVKTCSNYSTEALLKTVLPQDTQEGNLSLPSSTAFPMDFPSEPIIMNQSEVLPSIQAKQKTYSNRSRKQDCWNNQNMEPMHLTPVVSTSAAQAQATVKQMLPPRSSDSGSISLSYLPSDPRLPTTQQHNIHFSPCVSAALPFPRFPGNTLLPSPTFSQHKPPNEPVPFTGIFPAPRSCTQSDTLAPSGNRYPGPRKPFSYSRPCKVSFPAYSPPFSSDTRKPTGKALPSMQQPSNAILSAPLSVGRAYPPFPTLPTQPAGPSGNSLANFNLSTIFPEMNKNYQYP